MICFKRICCCSKKSSDVKRNAELNFTDIEESQTASRAAQGSNTQPLHSASLLKRCVAVTVSIAIIGDMLNFNDALCRPFPRPIRFLYIVTSYLLAIPVGFPYQIFTLYLQKLTMTSCGAQPKCYSSPLRYAQSTSCSYSAETITFLGIHWAVTSVILNKFGMHINKNLFSNTLKLFFIINFLFHIWLFNYLFGEGKKTWC